MALYWLEEAGCFPHYPIFVVAEKSALSKYGSTMTVNAIGKKKILLVDDDETHLSMAELILEDDYDIYKAMSGTEALKYLVNNELTPDLILLDIIMPIMDGWELFNRIKAISLLKNVPIVFVTSMDGEKERKRAREMGAKDYITKPFNMTFLKDTVRRIFEISVQQQGA